MKKEIIILIIKETIKSLFVGFLIFYTFLSLNNEFSYCEIELNTYGLNEEISLYKNEYKGSKRSIEEQLGLERYKLGLYADYSPINKNIIRYDCEWRNIIKWKI